MIELRDILLYEWSIVMRSLDLLCLVKRKRFKR